jgi:hypothetical protein
VTILLDHEDDIMIYYLCNIYNYIIYIYFISVFAGVQEALYDTKEGGMPAGVVMGLAWNPLGIDKFIPYDGQIGDDYKHRINLLNKAHRWISSIH